MNDVNDARDSRTKPSGAGPNHTGERVADRAPLQVRLPRDVYDQLKERSELQREPMNRLVVAALVPYLNEETGEVIATRGDISDAKVDRVVDAIAHGDIGALKGTARHYRNSGFQHLSALLYWTAAEQIARGAPDRPADPKQAARELIHSANAARHWPVAIALLQAARRHDPNNPVVASQLGYLLCVSGRWDESLEYLTEALAARDTRSRLFRGWSEYEIALRDGTRTDGPLDEIVAALESWAFGAYDERQRSQWLEQLARLEAKGHANLVDQLLTYADDNTSWATITPAERAAAVGKVAAQIARAAAQVSEAMTDD